MNIWAILLLTGAGVWWLASREPKTKESPEGPPPGWERWDLCLRPGYEYKIKSSGGQIPAGLSYEGGWIVGKYAGAEVKCFPETGIPIYAYQKAPTSG